MIADGAVAAPILTNATPTSGWNLQARARNGGAASELALQLPSVAARNAPGAPAWTFGQATHFQMSYAAASSVLTLGVDFANDGTIAAAETVSHSFATYAGQGFRLVNLLIQGSATGQAKLENVVINGVAVGGFGFTQNNTIQRTFADTSGVFGDLLISGDLILSANGGSNERPRMILRLGDALPLIIAESETVPEPAGLLVLGAAGAALGLVRRKRRGVS